MDTLTIIANGTVLTCDDDNRAGRLDIVVRNGKILEVSNHQETTSLRYPNAVIVDAKGKLLLPGFVNAHVHSESILLRERTQFLPMAFWKQDIRINEARKQLLNPSNRDDVRVLFLYTYFSHLRSGTTCVGEFLPEIDGRTLIAVLQSIERTGVTPVVTIQTWDQLRTMRDLGSSKPSAHIGLGSEADWTVHKFQDLAREATEQGIPILPHIAEQHDDIEPVRKNFLKEPLDLLQKFSLLQQQSAIVHGNHLSGEDCSVAESMQLSVAVSPLSSSIKQTGYPALRQFVERNVRLALCTDWGTCDIIEEMKFMYRLPLVVSGLPRFRAMDVVRMATINGARALNVSSNTGSLEPGKRADITMLSLDRLGVPDTERLDAEGIAHVLLTHLTSNDVSDVMVNGEFVVRNHTLMTIDESDVRESFHAMLPKYFPLAQTSPQYRKEEFGKAKIFPFWQTRGPEIRKGLEGFVAAEEGKPKTNPVPGFKDDENRPKTSNRVFGEDDLP